MNNFEFFYHDIDERVSTLTRLNTSRLHCAAGCCDCCIDDVSVFEVEARNIRTNYRDLLDNALPHPAGACAFLDGRGQCRIYEHRPYVCRTQGLPLHWVEENDDNTATCYRDICPKNDEGIPVELLSEDFCWNIGPAEEKLAMMQYKLGNGSMARIRLRDLFKPQG
jgi:Fe-S-cluster containining protein